MVVHEYRKSKRPDLLNVRMFQNIDFQPHTTLEDENLNSRIHTISNFFEAYVGVVPRPELEKIHRSIGRFEQDKEILTEEDIIKLGRDYMDGQLGRDHIIMIPNKQLWPETSQELLKLDGKLSTRRTIFGLKGLRGEKVDAWKKLRDGKSTHYDVAPGIESYILLPKSTSRETHLEPIGISFASQDTINSYNPSRVKLDLGKNY